MGIIGVVAEMTIPTLISDFQDRATTTALKSTTTKLQEALSLAVANEGNIESWYAGTDHTAGRIAVNTMLTKYLRVAQNCHEDVNSECLPSRYYFLYSPTAGMNYNTASYSKLMLNDGTIVFFNIGLFGISGTDVRLGNIDFYIDTNGLNKPNRWGYDLFEFTFRSKPSVDHYLDTGLTNLYLKPKKVMPYGTIGGAISNCNPSAFDQGEQCASWAYYIGNRDYKKCATSLNWETQTTCP